MRALPLVLIGLSLAGCKSSSGPTGKDMSGSYDFSGLHKVLFGGQWKTEGVVVLYKGQLVYEEYGGGYTASMRHIAYSASKSLENALVGVAVNDKLLALSDSVCKYVTPPAGADATLCDTTIEHLVHMSSGLSWIEDYGTGDPTTSNVLQMLYGNVTDMGAYTATQPRAHAAGSFWNYSSGEANLLALALKNAVPGGDLDAWATKNVYGPAGLDVLCENDGAGTPVMSSWCYLTPRELAKFGQLYLDDGMVSGTRVLPAGWVTYTRTPAPPVAQAMARQPEAGVGNSGGSYGALFWLNGVSASASPDTYLYPQMPGDAYSAEGHYGQKVFILPTQQLVVARTGNDRAPIFDPGPMVMAAMAAVGVGK